jgi:cytochrome P450
MCANATDPVYWDPYKPELTADPYPTFRRLREEAPLFYNKEHDFYTLSRFDDVQNGLRDHETFISGKGAILEIIKGGFEMPPGVFIFEDPPQHTAHRGILARVFTPKAMNALEGKVRQFTQEALDPLVGLDGFDLIGKLGAVMPMEIIGMLLGIPDEDLQKVRQQVDDMMRTTEGESMTNKSMELIGQGFGDYIDWREKNPTDDLMTKLLHEEFVDETGTKRKLSRDELLTFINILAGAGNETTNRLIGWTGKVLAEHPDQRRQLVADPSLIPQAIEELLRFEPPPPHIARYVSKDVEYYGQKVPEGSVMIMLVGSANRDDRRFVDGDTFNINRERKPHLTFGYGIHTCLGSALARLEGRIALEELLKRFPEWDVDLSKAKLSPTSTVRGWETLPIIIGKKSARAA